ERARHPPAHRPTRATSRPAGGRLPAHAAPLLRQPPARRRRGPPDRPGVARPCQPGHDPGLHPCLRGTSPGDLSHCPPPRAIGSPATAIGSDTPRPIVSVTSRTLARAGMVVTFAFLGSRVLGWFRLVVIGNLFGAGPDLDAYYAAFRIPDLVYQL